jgi:hypothetical protein
VVHRGIEELVPRRAARSDGRARSAPGSDIELGGFNESSVAINPTDPTNVAYASLFEIRVSTDGGTTFRTPVPPIIPFSHSEAGDPVVAFDAQGRLFWTYIALEGDAISASGNDIFVAQCNPATGAILPGYPVNVTTQAGLPATGGHGNDKQWFAADSWPGSSFANNLYLVWTDFAGTNERTYSSVSTDQGLTWSAALQLAGATTAFKWPCHLAVAPNGDVYAAEHRQQAFANNVPDGISGRIRVYRSTDGGVSFPQATSAFGSGAADMTFNVQTTVGAIPQTEFWLQGSVQPWVLPDPLTPGDVYVVANDDPDNNPTSGDAANVYIARSTDSGNTWGPPIRVDSGPGTTLQVMPAATIDPTNGNIAVTWYDNREGGVNGSGNWLLDVYAAVSPDRGLTFGQDFKVSDSPFDPDAGATCRFGCGSALAGAWVESATNAYVCGSPVLHWDGSTWSEVNTGSTVFNAAVWGASGNAVWTVGELGDVRHFDGVVWSAQASGTTEWLVEVHGRGATDVYTVGGAGTILHWNGTSWTPQASGTTEDLWGDQRQLEFPADDN